MATGVTYGKVVGRIVQAVAADAGDENVFPATGWVIFVPEGDEWKIGPDGEFIENPLMVHCPLAEEGDSEGIVAGTMLAPRPDEDSPFVEGVWLAAGRWTVKFLLGTGRVASFSIMVTPIHTEESPLDLTKEYEIQSHLVESYLGIAGAEDWELVSDANVSPGYFGNLSKTLTRVDLPNYASSVHSKAFTAAARLVSVTMPKATNIGSSAFEGCQSLEYVEVTGVTGGGDAGVGEKAFAGTPVLKALVLRAASVVPVNPTTFTNSAIRAGGPGFVYVPDGLVSSYKSAAGWSDLAGQIKPLSALPA